MRCLQVILCQRLQPVDNAVLAAEASCAAPNAVLCCLQFWLPGSIKDLRGLQPEEKQWLADRKQADKAAAQNVSRWQGTIWGGLRCRCFILTSAGGGMLTWAKGNGVETLLLLDHRQAAHTQCASAIMVQPEGTHLPTGGVSAAVWRQGA